jgi:hypothetical protein
MITSLARDSCYYAAAIGMDGFDGAALPGAAPLLYYRGRLRRWQPARPSARNARIIRHAMETGEKGIKARHCRAPRNYRETPKKHRTFPHFSVGVLQSPHLVSSITYGEEATLVLSLPLARCGQMSNGSKYVYPSRAFVCVRCLGSQLVVTADKTTHQVQEMVPAFLCTKCRSLDAARAFGNVRRPARRAS